MLPLSSSIVCLRLFFFQAEDGIRDFCLSRGLGDVYKRQGFVFVGPNGNPMSTRGLSLGLKRCAKRYGVNPDVVYPHSFRHRFAKNFIAKNPDIAFLADLMGHESIETTRIYLRRTAEEQRAAVDKAIDW